MATETVETKVTEFEDGGSITETITTETEFVPGDEAPVIVADEILPIETPSDAVAIAAIEAEARVEVEEIHAETAIALAEKGSEGIEECRESLTALSQRVETLASAVEQLLTPPPLVEEITVEEAPTMDMSMTGTETPSIIKTEAESESAEENQEPEATPVRAHVKRHRRLI